jgi:hypothetical protein
MEGEGGTHGVYDVVVPQAYESLAHASAGDTFAPAYNGGLGQTGGAGREDEHGHLGVRLLCAVLVWDSERLCSRRLDLDLGSEDKTGDALELLANLVVKVGGDIDVDDAQLCVRGLDAVDQGLALQVVVDAGGLGPQGPDGEPDEDVLVRVLEVHGDDVARADAVGQAQPGAVPQDLVVDLGEGPGAALEEDEGLVGVGPGLGPALQDVEGVEAVGMLAVEEAGGGGDGAADEVEIPPDGRLGVDVGGCCEGCGWGGHGGEGDCIKMNDGRVGAEDLLMEVDVWLVRGWATNLALLMASRAMAAAAVVSR